MKFKNRHRLIPFILYLIFYSSPMLAFSTPPEDGDDYNPADWANSKSAEDDARSAIEHNDLRLLGFAGRGSFIPGIDSSQSQDYSEKCGVRFFEEFGDVIREREQLEAMKKAKEYAKRYNKVILTGCTLDN